VIGAHITNDTCEGGDPIHVHNEAYMFFARGSLSSLSTNLHSSRCGSGTIVGERRGIHARSSFPNRSGDERISRLIRAHNSTSQQFPRA
jgi:hypothetical protein